VKAKKEILGLRIINVQMGKEVGTIKDIVLDSVRGEITYFILDEPSDYLGARLISYKNTIGMGNFALTVTGENIIQDVAHCPPAIELLREDVQIVGTQVLTDKGGLLGTVSEIFFSEDTGRIAQCRIQNEYGKTMDIARENIVTFGKLLTIVKDDCTLSPVEGGPLLEGTLPFGRISTPLTADRSPKKERLGPNHRRKDPYSAVLGPDLGEGISGNALASAGKTDREPLIQAPSGRRSPRNPGEQKLKPTDGQNQEASSSGMSSDVKNQEHQKISLAELVYPEGFNPFDKRQMQFLLGKKLTHKVRLDSGDIMEEGEFITAEMLSRVQTRATLMELTAHVKK